MAPKCSKRGVLELRPYLKQLSLCLQILMNVSKGTSAWMGSAETPRAPSSVPVGRGTSCQQQETSVKVGVWQHQLLWSQFKAPGLKNCTLSKVSIFLRNDLDGCFIVPKGKELKLKSGKSIKQGRIRVNLKNVILVISTWAVILGRKMIFFCIKINSTKIIWKFYSVRFQQSEGHYICLVFYSGILMTLVFVCI